MSLLFHILRRPVEKLLINHLWINFSTDGPAVIATLSPLKILGEKIKFSSYIISEISIEFS